MSLLLSAVNDDSLLGVQSWGESGRFEATAIFCNRSQLYPSFECISALCALRVDLKTRYSSRIRRGSRAKTRRRHSTKLLAFIRCDSRYYSRPLARSIAIARHSEHASTVPPPTRPRTPTDIHKISVSVFFGLPGKYFGETDRPTAVFAGARSASQREAKTPRTPTLPRPLRHRSADAQTSDDDDDGRRRPEDVAEQDEVDQQQLAQAIPRQWRRTYDLISSH